MRPFLLAFLLLCKIATPAWASNPAPTRYVQRSGQYLTVGGKRIRLIGVNRYELAGGPGVAQCRHWGSLQDYRTWVKTIVDDAVTMKCNVIRIWAFQNFLGPSGKDFTHFDWLIAYAKSQGVRLIATLTNNWDACDAGGIKTAAFFSGGYKTPYGGYRFSLPAHINNFVSRYKNEPAIAAWEVINEGKCTDAPASLAKFISDAAAQIRSISPHHLIIGGGALQDWQGDAGVRDFASFSNSANVDIVTHHDYGQIHNSWPSGIAQARDVARQQKKPFLIGEAGVLVGEANPNLRGNLFSAKIGAAGKQDTAGFLIWSIGVEDGGLDGYDFTVGTPTAKALSEARGAWALPLSPNSILPYKIN